MAELGIAQLPDLARALQGTFPAADDAALARALLRLLAQGRPVEPEVLAQASGRDSVAVGAQLDGWPNLERDEAGAVSGFAGLTLRQTAHSFTVAGRELHTWCAWDTLFLPSLLDATASVRSTCPVTGSSVELTVAPDGVVSAAPAELSVSFPALATTDTSDITSSFCCDVHFLIGDAADQWRAEHPTGRVLDVQSAYELGQETVGPLLCAGQDREQI